MDCYDTPDWCVEWLLNCPAFIGSICAGETPRVWCDPCAGSGSIVGAVNAWSTKHPDCTPLPEWLAWDVAPRSPIVRAHDYLDAAFDPPRVDVLFTNPPYSMAEEFIRKAVTHSSAVVMLLRLPFLASRKRLPLWSAVGTPDVYVLAKRPSFTGGGTDATDYAWFSWPVTAAKEKASGVVRVLDGSFV
jgi:hypothetical protein